VSQIKKAAVLRLREALKTMADGILE